MLKNAYLDAKFRFDTAENEACKVCRTAVLHRWSTAYTQYATELRIFCAVVRGGSGEDFDILEVPIEVRPTESSSRIFTFMALPASTTNKANLLVAEVQNAFCEVTPADAGRPLWDANVVPALFAPVSASPAAAAALEDAETPDSRRSSYEN